MAGFNFEKNLEHKSIAVESTIAVFDGIEIIEPKELEKQCIFVAAHASCPTLLM